jgi:hypothetical protein
MGAMVIAAVIMYFVNRQVQQKAGKGAGTKARPIGEALAT